MDEQYAKRKMAELGGNYWFNFINRISMQKHAILATTTIETLQLGNHDVPRIADRFDPSSVDSINMLLLLLPGTPIVYNGDEIGMTGSKIRWDQTTDVYALDLGPMFYEIYSRDPERTPFQWNSSRHAGLYGNASNSNLTL